MINNYNNNNNSIRIFVLIQINKKGILTFFQVDCKKTIEKQFVNFILINVAFG